MHIGLIAQAICLADMLVLHFKQMQTHRANAKCIEMAHPVMQDGQTFRSSIQTMERHDKSGGSILSTETFNIRQDSIGIAACALKTDVPAQIVQFSGSIYRDANIHIVDLEQAQMVLIQQNTV